MQDGSKDFSVKSLNFFDFLRVMEFLILDEDGDGVGVYKPWCGYQSQAKG